jgi:predicted flap endonuclease-1-like 5' DNA nuclease
LLTRGATPEGRAQIASQSLIGSKLIDGWVSAIDLTRVKGIGAQYAELLVAAGVASVGDLSQRNAESLGEQLVAVNETSKKVRVLPGASQLESWIDQAKTLPAVLTQTPSA